MIQQQPLFKDFPAETLQVTLMAEQAQVEEEQVKLVVQEVVTKMEEMETLIVLQEALLQEAAAEAAELEQTDPQQEVPAVLEAAVMDLQVLTLEVLEQLTPEAVEAVEVFNHTHTDLLVLVDLV